MLFKRKINKSTPLSNNKEKQPFIQPSLKMGKSGDKYEIEADKVVNNDIPANAVQKKEGEEEVQQKPLALEITPLIQKMEASEEEPVQKMEEEESIQKKEEEEPIQKKEQEEPVKKKEEEEVQAKSNNKTKTTNSIEGKLRNGSGGTKMDNQTKNEMESGFGADFSQVNIHNDNEAAQMSQDIGAQAFTHGNDVYFNNDKYNPDSKEGKHLLAHELTHTIQQRTKNQINRKIEVNNKKYSPTKKYLTWLQKNYGKTAVNIVKMMYNYGKSPIHKFDSFEALGYEVRVRNKAVKGMDEVHNGCCNYPSSKPNGYLDHTYWKRIGFMNFTAKSPLPSGKKASDAIKAIFASGAKTQLECLTMTVAIEYYSLLKGLGERKFNKMFPGGVGLVINVKSKSNKIFYTPKYEIITVSKSELLPGDWVYFKNFTDYINKHPNGLWQGENAIVMGPDKFRGFGVKKLSEQAMNQELVDAYNKGLPKSGQKDIKDLLAQGGGLLNYPVIRPVIKEILK